MERAEFLLPRRFRHGEPAPAGRGLILYTGAKVKKSATEGVAIDDPESLLKWPAKDRAIATFRDSGEIEAKRGALTAILRQWIAAMEPPS
jgi:hypothetical protein